MLVGALGENAAPGGPLQEALLEEIGLEHILDRVLLLADRDRQRGEADFLLKQPSRTLFESRASANKQ